MYSNILVPVDLDHGDTGGGSLLLARYIGGPEARITLLTVTDSQFSAFAAHVRQQVLDGHDKDVRERLRELAHEIDEAAVVVVRHGKPAEEILEEAESLGADAIVLASHKPHLRNHLLGSTAARVVKYASCSVLVDRSSV